MEIFLCILVYVLLLLICITGVFKKKQWGEVIIIFVLITAGFTLSLLLVIGVKVPNPNKAIASLIKLIFQIKS